MKHIFHFLISPISLLPYIEKASVFMKNSMSVIQLNCPNKACTEIISYEKFSSHTTECPFFITSCTACKKESIRMNLKNHQEGCLEYWKNRWYKTNEKFENSLKQIDIVNEGRDIANAGREIAEKDLKENAVIYQAKMEYMGRVTNYEDMITAGLESKLDGLTYV